MPSCVAVVSVILISFDPPISVRLAVAVMLHAANVAGRLVAATIDSGTVRKIIMYMNFISI